MALRVDLGRVEVLNMRELTLHTARVIEQIRKDGLPRAIAKHGRFLASLWPLAENFESELLARAIGEGKMSVDLSGDGKPVDELLSEETAMESDENPYSAESPAFGAVSMAEFNQSTSAVVERVHAGQRLFVTRHGRYVALLTPLPKNLESFLIASVPEFIQTMDMGSRDGVGYGFQADIAEALTDS